MLIKAAPEETREIDEIDPIHQHQYHSRRCQNDLLRVCSDAFKKVEEELLKSILLDQRHCIFQLKESKKRISLLISPSYVRMHMLMFSGESPC